jgi:hypothetical protein
MPWPRGACTCSTIPKDTVRVGHCREVTHAQVDSVLRTDLVQASRLIEWTETFPIEKIEVFLKTLV